MSSDLPVHFFTIVLNGEPFIRRHIEQFKKLDFGWHWHVIEGVAELTHDTAWSLRNGGRIGERFQRGGLSVDGTSEYLEELARNRGQVTLYRKPPGQRWDGKVEMVRAPLRQLSAVCLLWQVDVDELWTAEQITVARQMFLDHPEKTAAYYRCWFFLGPDLVTTTLIPPGPSTTDWLRTWRYRPGMQWPSHEPPVLAEPAEDGKWRDVARVNPFSQDETERAGLVFQHYAYANLKTLQFKQEYYGYAGVVERWEAMQRQASYPVRVRDFFPWFAYDSHAAPAGPEVPPRLIEQPAVRDASYLPPQKSKHEVRQIAFVRTDAIGDNVMAGSMLPHLKKAYPNARISVVCQEPAAPLYEACPLVESVVRVERVRGYQEPEYREAVAKQVRKLGADLCLNSVYSREPLMDFLCQAGGSAERVAFRGDVANIPPQQRDANDATYTRVIADVEPFKPELERHRDFLRALDIPADELSPQIWTTPQDAEFADAFFARHGLDPAKTIALFPGGQFPVKDYEHFGQALRGLCEARGFRVVALGTAREADLIRRNLTALAPDTVNATGETTLRQSAEILRRCRLAVGTDTGLAHVACAVGTRNVILLGGGHFGRFLPYSPLTTVVCLPLDCYGCNWNCRFTRPYCVRDVSPAVIAQAVRMALDEELPGKPVVVAQDRSLWQQPPGGPNWGWFHAMLARNSIELVTIGRRGGETESTHVRPPRRHAWDSPRSEFTARRLSVATQCLQATTQQLPDVFAREARALARDHELADLPAAADERVLVDEILSGLARGENDPFAVQYRAAAMLYFRMHELEPWDPSRIPSWLFDDFVAWTIRHPGLLLEVGEADEYFRRVLAWFEAARGQLDANPQNEVWRRLAEPMALLPNLIPAYFTAADLLPLMRARSDIMEMYLRFFNTPLDMDPLPRPDARKRIRLGILKNHWLAGTEAYATLPLFEHLPRDRFEVILYVLEEARDAAEASCKSKADRFVVLPPAVNDQAALIRRDQCDVLFYAINMTAVTHNLVPLALHRLAPVQATSICSPCTSGMLNMDVFLAGELTEPREDAQSSYREKLIKLPGSGICFDYALRPPPSNYTISREMLKLGANTVVLTSGANYFKVIPELRRAWAKMLAASPEQTVLLLYPFGPAWTNTYPAGSFMRCFRDELAAAGVDPARLILLQPMDSPTDVRKVMAITDIYVDSFPYTGATSLLDPLEAGVPPVTMAGDRLRFAQGEALLRELGTPELIATSADHYIQLVAELARDGDLRERRRASVREKMAAGPAFLDSKRFGAKAAEVFEMLVKDAAGRL